VKDLKFTNSWRKKRVFFSDLVHTKTKRHSKFWPEVHAMHWYERCINTKVQKNK